jgi:hypothetical protein
MPRIVPIRDEPVMLDAELARVYGVTTKALNQAVKRNAGRFPADFVFRLRASEWKPLRSQFVTLENQGRGQHRKYLPLVFTEHGAIMAANVLNSPRAVTMSVYVVRAFVRVRRELLGRTELQKRRAEIERTLVGHDLALQELYGKIKPLLLPPTVKPQRQIGFHVRD